jgi:hypothetical protein
LKLLAHRAWNPPPSSSLAEETPPPLAPPPCGGARLPTLAAFLLLKLLAQMNVATRSVLLLKLLAQMNVTARSFGETILTSR